MVAITQQSMLDEIRRQQLLARSISSDQAAISSGKKLITPSQDPRAWVQVSQVAQAQAQQAAWTANVKYAQTRSDKAESNLDEINNLMARARELYIAASTSTLDEAGKASTVTSLEGLRKSINDLLTEKDYQGLPVFDDTTSVAVPVGRGLDVETVGTRQAVSEGINVGGTPMSIDDIMGAAIAAVQAGTATSSDDGLTGLNIAIDHIIGQQSLQGVRSERLEQVTDRLKNVDLNLTERRGNLEDTDLTETITKLQNKLLTLEAAQAAFARINRQSLFDLIS
ncbi:flagellin [Sphingobium phenoxybenzoativorans]|uniref:Flagellin n=1 Tax=Sphingobium phenoxybenzoativorans TaxID=1592790 RepID=A0A975Q1X6_9SPHN|nr:flagellin [Sphingobium phenoxybenzoativorans]QUT05848.1 flagellin [Sphingobium phenoxybenzoativorans]